MVTFTHVAMVATFMRAQKLSVLADTNVHKPTASQPTEYVTEWQTAPLVMMRETAPIYCARVS